MFNSIKDVYDLLSDTTTLIIPREMLAEAFKCALKEYEKKYGKDDYRYSELFALSLADYWRDTERFRAMIHAEVNGCTHEKPHKDCSHCKLLYTLYRKWSIVPDNKPIDNTPIYAEGSNGKWLKYPRCGICDVNNITDYDAHIKTLRHINLVQNYHILQKITDGHISQKEIMRASQKITSEKLLKDFEKYLVEPEATKLKIAREIRKECEELAKDIYKTS